MPMVTSWARTINFGKIASYSISPATSLAPPNPQESALLIWLLPGAYTAIVRGNNGGTGIGLLEAYSIQ